MLSRFFASSTTPSFSTLPNSLQNFAYFSASFLAIPARRSSTRFTEPDRI